MAAKRWKYARAVRNNAPNYFVVTTGEWGAPAIAECQEEDHARLITTAPDLAQQVYALTHGWTVIQAPLYDEEGIEGWIWTDPQGREYTVIGDWDELPPWSDALSAAVAKETGAEKAAATWYLNEYTCPQCQTSWRDAYDGQPDDACPKCGMRHISPHTSTAFSDGTEREVGT